MRGFDVGESTMHGVAVETLIPRSPSSLTLSLTATNSKSPVQFINIGGGPTSRTALLSSSCTRLSWDVRFKSSEDCPQGRVLQVNVCGKVKKEVFVDKNATRSTGSFDLNLKEVSVSTVGDSETVEEEEETSNVDFLRISLYRAEDWCSLSQHAEIDTSDSEEEVLISEVRRKRGFLSSEPAPRAGKANKRQKPSKGLLYGVKLLSVWCVSEAATHEQIVGRYVTRFSGLKSLVDQGVVLPDSLSDEYERLTSNNSVESAIDLTEDDGEEEDGVEDVVEMPKEVAAFLGGNSHKFNAEDASKAAAHGRLDVLKYLHDNGCPWNEKVTECASLRNHLDCLKYLHDNGCPWDDNATSAAAAYNNLDCLKYLHENGCYCDKDTINFAAEYGSLDCLKYLHEKGCPWSGSATTEAAANGHLDCLKYLNENGCDIYFQAIDEAHHAGHFDCLKYLHQASGEWVDNIGISDRCKVYWSIFRDMVKARSVAIYFPKYKREKEGGLLEKERESAAVGKPPLFVEGLYELFDGIHEEHYNLALSWFEEERFTSLKAAFEEEEDIVSFLTYVRLIDKRAGKRLRQRISGIYGL